MDISAGLGTNILTPHNGTVAQLGPFPLPYELEFVGFSYTVQALCGDMPRGFLSNGLVEGIGIQ